MTVKQKGKKIRERTPHALIIERVHGAEKLATQLSKMDLAYLWGGARTCDGHMCKPHKGKPWTDCSGCTQYLIEKGLGIKLENPVGNTFSLAVEGEAGTSEYFTILIKNDAGDEHVIIRFRKKPKPWHLGLPRYRYFECGGSDNPSTGDGPSWFIPGIRMGLTWKKRVAEFYIPRNFDAQLGAN